MKMVKRMSATLDETRKLAPAAAGRWFASINKSNGEPPLHVRFATLDFSVSGFSQWHHRADTCAWSRTGASTEPLPTRQMSARFRPHTRLTRQLCNRSIPLRFNFAGCISTPLHSDGRKLARQSGTNRARPNDGSCGKHWPQDFVRPASNSPRVVARGQGNSNTARGSACRRGQAIAPRGFARCKTWQ